MGRVRLYFCTPEKTGHLCVDLFGKLVPAMYLRNATIAVLFSALLYSPLFLFSKPEGFEIDARVTGYPFPGENSCAQSNCHGDGMGANKGMGNIAISIHGQPASAYSYSPGETVPVRVTISEPSSLQQRFGFQITSRTPDGCTQAGMFSMAGDPNLLFFLDSEATAPCQPEPIQFVTHGLAATREPPSMQPVTFELNWTAPSTDIGPIVIAAAGNAANGDTKKTGDNIYTTGVTIELASVEPTHEIGSVFDGASFLPVLSPGGIASIFGTFAETSSVSTSVPLSLSLNGFSLTFDDVPGAIFGVFGEDLNLGFHQANVQVPHDVDVSDGKINVRVHWKDESGDIRSEPFEVDAALASPGIFSFDFGPGRAIIQNLDGTFAQPAGSLGTVAARPARINDFIIVWCHGLGPLDLAPVGGELPTGDVPGFDGNEPPSPILLFPRKEVWVFIGGIRSAVVVPFLHPTLVALSQINVQIPEGVIPGDAVPIVIKVDNVFSSRGDVTIAVAATP